MNCAESEVLIHALIDGELDAGHAREVEAHVATCRGCAASSGLSAMRAAITARRAEREGAGPSAPPRRGGPARRRRRGARRPSRCLPAARRGATSGGFALGTAVSAAVAASVVITSSVPSEDRRIAGEIVSAHLRSLQGSHLTDVETSDQHTVKPWFNGKLALSPPVVDLTAQGFTLIGGRLDYVDGEAMAAIVYKRRKHLINLFVGPRLGGAPRGAKTAMVQGFNVYHWAQDGLGFWAVSDINADELAEFGRHIADTIRPPSARP